MRKEIRFILSSLSSLNGSPLPNAFNLTSFGTISWTPNNSDVGPNILIVVVKDTMAYGGQSSQTFDLTVKNVNNSPVITNKINTILNINEKETFTYTFNTSDQDAGDVLAYSVNASTALSPTINNQGVLISWHLALMRRKLSCDCVGSRY